MNCLDIYRERPVRLTVRALVPVKEHPKVGVTEGPPSRLTTFIRRTRCKLSLFQFNFVGKLLGPKGNSMKRLQEHTMTKMAVLGKGSMRDRHQVNWIIPSEVYPLSRILCARNLISQISQTKGSVISWKSWPNKITYWLPFDLHYFYLIL